MDRDAKNILRGPRRNPKIMAIFLLTVFLFLPSLLYAQEDRSFLIQLMNRVEALENDNRDLRGQLEESRHELSLLSKRMETLSADVDYRLTNSESGAPPLPLGEMKPDAFSSPPRREASTASEDYENARTLLELGDYGAAEQAFSSFVLTFPKDNFAGPAQYWLGITYFVRGQHEKAAAAFAKGHKTYPKSPKAADNLLKLVKSLSALDRKADACIILDQLSAEYPKSLVKEVAAERKTLGCW